MSFEPRLTAGGGAAIFAGPEDLNESTPEDDFDTLPGLCPARHPLLDGIRCQRMSGHPGRHGAHMDTSSAEMTLEWDRLGEGER